MAAKIVVPLSPKHVRWTNHSKRQAALSTHDKGRSFLAAAALPDKHKGSHYVVLHLLCQGAEAVVKSILLLRNFNLYEPKLQDKYGHKLFPLCRDALNEFGLKLLQKDLQKELQDDLSGFYQRHRLRYGSVLDMFIDPQTIPNDKVFRRLVAALRLIARELKKQGIAAQT